MRPTAKMRVDPPPMTAGRMPAVQASSRTVSGETRFAMRVGASPLNVAFEGLVVGGHDEGRCDPAVIAEGVGRNVADDRGEGSTQLVAVGGQLVQEVSRLVRLGVAVVAGRGVRLECGHQDVEFELRDLEPALDHAIGVDGQPPEFRLLVRRVFLLLEGCRFELVGPARVDDLHGALGRTPEVFDRMLLGALDQVCLDGCALGVIELAGELGHRAGDDLGLGSRHAGKAHRLTGLRRHRLQVLG